MTSRGRQRAKSVSEARIEAADHPQGPTKPFHPNTDPHLVPPATTAADSQKRAYQWANPHDALCLSSAEPLGLAFCWCKCNRCWDNARAICICKVCDCRSDTARALAAAQ